MHIVFARSLPARDASDDAPLSRQNIIIIAACSAAAALFLAYFFYRAVRRCRQSSNPAPLPPVQPLAHHREIHAAKVQDALSSRPQTWYQPTFPATHSVGSKASLLGTGQETPSTQSYATADGEESNHSGHLPLPTPSYRNGRPGSGSSCTSSDASCPSPNKPAVLLDSSAPALPRTVSELRTGHPPFRRHRPLSMSSTGSHNTVTSRTSRHTLRGVPHNSHIQIVLPTPLASANNSRESLALSNRRRSSQSLERRSVADSWLLMEPSTTTNIPHDASEVAPTDEIHSRRRRRPASMSSLSSSITRQQANVPPVPQLPSNLDLAPQMGPRNGNDSRWTPSHQTVHEEESDPGPRKPNKLEKKRRGG